MQQYIRLFVWLILLTVLFAIGVSAAAPGALAPLGRAPAGRAPLGSAFTYQGQLKNGGAAVNAACDLRAGLWDAPGAGAQIGVTQTLSQVPVSAGLFTVELNGAGEFGVQAFDGTARWLQTEVRCPAGSGVYARLDPRQALTAAPYALYARSAGSVQYAGVVIVAARGGQFTSIQAALDSIRPAPGEHYLVWVAPGTYSETVQMKAYVDLQGAGEGLTRIVAPGSTLLQAATLGGASQAEARDLTVENTGIAGNFNFATAIYLDHVDTHLTHVTAIASGGYNTYAVHADGGSPVLEHVTARASDATRSFGVFFDAGTPQVNDVDAAAAGVPSAAVIAIGGEVVRTTFANVRATASNAPGGGIAYALWSMHATITMTNVSANAFGATSVYGIYLNHSPAPLSDVIAVAEGGPETLEVFGAWEYISAPQFTNVQLVARGAPGATVYGVRNYGSSPILRNTTIEATGGGFSYGLYSQGSAPQLIGATAVVSATGTAYGLYNADGSVRITRSTIGVDAPAAYGIYNTSAGGSYSVRVDASQITAGTATIRSEPAFATYVGSSQLAGGAAGGGPVTCVGVYDENYAGAGYNACP